VSKAVLSPPPQAFAIDRRSLLGAGLAAASAGLVLPAAASASPKADWNDPAFNVRAFARLTTSIDPNVTSYILYEGQAFGIDGSGKTTPLYRIEGLGALKTQQGENGAVRFLMAECAMYLALDKNEVLDSWVNPISNRKVDVWHQRNGPVNFEIKPSSPSFGAFTRTGGAQGFLLPWVFDGDRATMTIDTVSNRKNPMTPADWPLESSGETLPTSEHSQYWTSRKDLENPKLDSVPYFAALQSLKPWHPWMMMGQAPGKVFTRMTSRKVKGPQALSAPALAYAQKNLSAYLEAPAEYNGAYVTAQSIYMKGRSPAK